MLGAFWMLCRVILLVKRANVRADSVGYLVEKKNHSEGRQPAGRQRVGDSHPDLTSLSRREKRKFLKGNP